MKQKSTWKFAAVLILVLAAATCIPVSRTVHAAPTNVYQDATSGFLKEATILASAARATSGDSGAPIDVGAYASGVILINVTAASGTPSMVVTYEVCEDSTTTLCGYSHSVTSAITGTGKTIMKVNNFGRYARLSYTISGGTPSLTFTAKGVFKPQT